MLGKGTKRALIVDDSRSARAFLSRILEMYQIEVDTADSAEHAIEYLGGKRPDVIFMDHLMPGMDGFQAVQAIKNNPRTATIPIMMYTAEEGELYVGQARALGAAGVLQKQIKPADVSKLLYELHLVPERRSPEPSAFKPVVVDGATPMAGPAPRVLTDTALREQFAELRRTLVASLDTQSERFAAELRTALRETTRPPAPAYVPAPRKPWEWMLASLVLAGALAGSVFWMNARITELERALVAASTAPALEPAPVAAADLSPLVLRAPYGEEPFGGDRSERVRARLDELAAAGHRGPIEATTFAGRFCLVGTSGGLAIAPDDMLFAQCDVVGNPFDDSTSASQHVPPDLNVTRGDPASVVQPYPAETASLTAGEWNRAAAANNRIEIRAR
ncbi:MAG: response regulator [Gammaproteobacteria bacterium]